MPKKKKAARFTGDKKLPMRSFFADAEKRFITFLTPHFPRWIEGYHLTLMTIVWCIGIILCGRLARGTMHWLWLSSLFIALQWFTDCFDGSLGRFRDTGIPKWGFYMDHLLDFVFLVSIFIGYSFLVQGYHVWVLYLLMLTFSGFMINSFLSFAATGEFKITYLGSGPTEMRLFFILLNAALIVFGIGFFKTALPFATVLALVVLTVVIFRTQKYIWNIDMAARKKRSKADHG
ncbi:MAG: CDP-alcohol phosphatidyltransferase family protein [Spirochaetota bacterium]